MRKYESSNGSDASIFCAGEMPLNPKVGDMWFYGDVGKVLVWHGSTWVALGPPPESWQLFLDDLRTTACLPAFAKFPDLVTLRTVPEVIQYIEQHGLPDAMSLDHDLGEGQEDAPRLLWYLIDGHLDGKWNCNHIRIVQVHSMNPEGVKNIIGLWSGFCKDQGIDCEIRRINILPETI